MQPTAIQIDPNIDKQSIVFCASWESAEAVCISDRVDGCHVTCPYTFLSSYLIGAWLNDNNIRPVRINPLFFFFLSLFLVHMAPLLSLCFCSSFSLPSFALYLSHRFPATLLLRPSKWRPLRPSITSTTRPSWNGTPGSTPRWCPRRTFAGLPSSAPLVLVYLYISVFFDNLHTHLPGPKTNSSQTINSLRRRMCYPLCPAPVRVFR